MLTLDGFIMLNKIIMLTITQCGNRLRRFAVFHNFTAQYLPENAVLKIVVYMQ
jgi:exoribonuclease II